MRRKNITLRKKQSRGQGVLCQTKTKTEDHNKGSNSVEPSNPSEGPPPEITICRNPQ